MLIVLLFTMQAVFGTLSAKPVSGRVTSAIDGEPLIGATVQVQGSLSGVVTDLEGNYTVLAEQGQTLVFSYMGFLTKSVKVGSNNTIDIVLENAVGAETWKVRLQRHGEVQQLVSVVPPLTLNPQASAIR